VPGGTGTPAEVTGPEAWEAFADGVLRIQAALSRIDRGGPPPDLPGLYVDDSEADRLMRPAAESAATAAERTHLRSLLGPLRAAFRASLDERTRFANLVRDAALSPDDAEVLALLAAVELDERRQRLAVYLQDSIHLPRITLATLGRAFDPPHPGARAVSEDARLRRACLVEVEGTGPWATRMASAAARVAWALVGEESRDPDLPMGTESLTDEFGRGTADLVLVAGPDRATRLRAAAERCAGSDFLVGPAAETPAGWDALVREATVTGAGVILEVGGELTPEARDRIERADHLAWAVSSPTELAIDRLPRRPWVEIRVDDGAATGDDWRRVLGSGPPTHRLGREQLRLVGLAAAALDGDVDAAVRRLASGHLDPMATRVRPTRGWPDLVVPDDQREQLEELVSRYRHGPLVHRRWGFPQFPSPGLVALFSGASGTGKTLAAEVVAGELGLDLYKVDLSSVVSKYIGETEKNLERIFSGAAAGELVLFFDEADALFGKRSEVADAHDRYANIEVAYLLQRLETYDGIAIMATNLQRNMDQSFLRRIHVAVEFPVPDEEGRRAIWQLSFPPDAPTEDIDVDFLARQFRISGGSIRNAALTAAFIAAEAGGPITMEAAVLGVKREFQKLGRLRTEVEFDRYFDLVREEIDAASVG
jgi:ATPase family protein associated with various cellular activities (AAA)/winged helix domain-containing protein